MTPLFSSPNHRAISEVNRNPQQQMICPQESITNFWGFSRQDDYFGMLVMLGICNEKGEATEEVKKRCNIDLFASIPKDHEIYSALKELVDPVGKRFTIYKLIRQLEHIPSAYLEKNELGSWVKKSSPIQAVQITGSKAWRLLIQHSDLLVKSFAKLFEPHRSEKEVQEWLAPLMERYKTLKTQEGKEVDVRMLCPGAGLEYLARLSEAAKSIFAKLQLPENCSMHKFALINGNSSLVGFKLNKGEAEEREYELFFTNCPSELSNDKCVVLSFSKQNVIIDHCGFDLVQILVALTRTYIPNVDNEQALVRYCEETDLVAAHDYEKKMVEASFAAVENSQLHQLFDQISFTAVLTSLSYYPSAVQRAVSPQGKFCSAKEEAICRYLYTLIRRRISSKKEQSTASSNALFAIRFCQALWQHGKLSDSGVKNLLIWLKADGILIPEEMSPFLKVSVEALLNGLSFTTFSALLTVMTWIHQPKTFTLRCTPPVFNIELPHTLRVCANVEAALKEFTRFFLSDENTLFAKEICRQLRLPFLAKTKEYQRQICQVLKLDEAFIEQLAAPLLDHSDFFIRSMALELSAKCDGYLFAKSLVNHLPILIQKQQIDLLTNLHQKLTSDLGLPAKNPFDVCKLSDWILLFLSCRQSKMTFYAYALWKENTHLVEESVDLELLTALCKEEPRVALELLTSLFAYRPLSPKFLQQKLALIEQNYPFETLFLLESYPLIEKIVTSEVFNNKPFPPSFIDHLLSFITRLENKEQQRYLLLALLFAQNIHYSQLTAELQKPLKPFAPFLHHYQNYELRFSSKEKIQFLALFDPAAPKSLPREIKEQWMKLLIWFYYPDAAPQTSEKIDLCLKNLNAYFKTATGNLVAFKEIQALLLYAAHLTEESNTCLGLNASQLIALQQINCYLHSDKAASIPLWRNFDLLIPKLPSLLQAPEKHTYALKCLFNEAMQKYPPKSALLNPLAAQDWVKLLAQTGQIDFIELASAIYYANEAACEKNEDLLLFEALTLAEPQKATDKLDDFLQNRQPPLSDVQLVTCIKLLSKSYQKHPDLANDKIFAILAEVAKTRKINSKLKSRFGKSFFYFIHQKKEKSASLALTCIARSLLKPEQMTEELFSHFFTMLQSKKQISTASLTAYLKIAHYLLEKDHPLFHRFLNEVLKQQEEALASVAAIYPQFFIDFLKKLVTSSQANTLRYQQIALLTSGALLASTPEIHLLIKGCLQRALREDFAKLSPSEISCIELLAFKNKEQLLKLSNWQPLTLEFLKYSSSAHAIDLFDFLLLKSRSLPFTQALVALSQILKKGLNKPLPAITKTYLEKSWPRCISKLIQEKAWQSVATYLHFFSQQRPVTKEIWSLFSCPAQKNLSAQDFFYVDLIKLSSFADWQNFLSAKSKQEISKEVPSVLKKLPFFVLEKEILEKEVLDWVAFILEKSLANSLDLKEIFASNLAAFGNIALQLLQQDISVSLKKELFFGGYLPVDELKTLAQREIEAQLDLLQPDFALCIELVSLCSDPASALLLLSPHLTSLQSPFLSLFAEQLSSAGFIDEKKQVHCWLLLFGRAAQISWQEADSYLETLPSAFHQAMFADEKKQAIPLLLQAAAKNFLQLKKEGSHEEELFAKHSLLKEKSADLSKITPAIYPLLFATLSAATIEKNYEKWLLALQQAFELDQTEEQEFLRPEFKQNFNILLNLKVVTHLFVDRGSLERRKMRKALTLATQICLIEGINKKCIDQQDFIKLKKLALSFIKEQASIFCNSEAEEISQASAYLLAKPFCHSLSSISALFDLHSEKEALFLPSVVAVLVKLQQILLLIQTEQPKEQEEIEIICHTLLAIIVPLNFEKLSLLHLEKIAQMVEEESDSHLVCFNVKYLIIERLITNLTSNSLTKDQAEQGVSLIKKSIEKEALIIYQGSLVHKYKIEKLRYLLLKAMPLPIFRNCPWLLTYLILLQASREAIKKLSSSIQEERNKEAHSNAIEILLLNRKQPMAVACALAVFFQHIAFNRALPESFQLTTFERLISLCGLTPEFKIEEQYLAHFIYVNCIRKIKNSVLNRSRTLSKLEKELLFAFTYRLFNISLSCLQIAKSLQQPGMQVSYTTLFFDIAVDLKKSSVPLQQIESYFSSTRQALNEVKELETHHLINKLPDFSYRSFSLLQQALFFSNQALNNDFYSQSSSTIPLVEQSSFRITSESILTPFLQLAKTKYQLKLEESNSIILFLKEARSFHDSLLVEAFALERKQLSEAINGFNFNLLFQALKKMQEAQSLQQLADCTWFFIDAYEILAKTGFFLEKEAAALSLLANITPAVVQTELFQLQKEDSDTLLKPRTTQNCLFERYFYLLFAGITKNNFELDEKREEIYCQFINETIKGSSEAPVNSQESRCTLLLDAIEKLIAISAIDDGPPLLSIINPIIGHLAHYTKLPETKNSCSILQLYIHRIDETHQNFFENCIHILYHFSFNYRYFNTLYLIVTSKIEMELSLLPNRVKFLKSCKYLLQQHLHFFELVLEEENSIYSLEERKKKAAYFTGHLLVLLVGNDIFTKENQEISYFLTGLSVWFTQHDLNPTLYNLAHLMFEFESMPLNYRKKAIKELEVQLAPYAQTNQCDSLLLLFNEMKKSLL